MTAGVRTARVGIVGGRGYTGGELLRILLGHPHAEVAFVTSRSDAGEPMHRHHPNLRGLTDLTFITPNEAAKTFARDAAGADGPIDAVFLCLPHGQSVAQLETWRAVAPVVVDLSADFRLRSPELYESYYGAPHPRPELLPSAVYGLPELHREELRTADLISGVGCNATAMNLALLPLARAGLIERVVADIKVGSSEGGADATAASHHPIRARAVRSYAPAGHRHAAEVIQEIGLAPERGTPFTLDVAVTAIEMVRGALCTAHVIPTEPVEMKQLWKLYRAAYTDEPFVRIVRNKTGLNRLPDTRVLGGSNFADVGFEVDGRTGRVVAICAIDNMVKGAAGSAVQSMNLRLGLPETAGLTFPGLHPA